MILLDFIISVLPYQTIRLPIYYIQTAGRVSLNCDALQCLYADTELDLKCLVNLSMAQPLITLAITLRDRTFNMTTEPSNRVIHMRDVLAFETESWEICHPTNSRII
jgi:hypothetical protein